MPVLESWTGAASLVSKDSDEISSPTLGSGHFAFNYLLLTVINFGESIPIYWLHPRHVQHSEDVALTAVIQALHSHVEEQAIEV
jgi:hypothetical protein